MKTIVHILFNMKLGGTESMLIDIMRQQVDLGFRVVLVLINDEHDAEMINSIDCQVEVKYLRRTEGSRNPLHLVNLNWMLLRCKPWVIHVHTVRALGMLFVLKRRIVFTAHCLGIESPYIAKAKRVFAISNAVKDNLMALHGIISTVVYNGIDTTAIKRSATHNKERFRIVQVGRMLKETKGQDILIEAVAKLCQQGVCDIDVDFIGDGASMSELKELVQERGLAHCVNFLGAMSRKNIYEKLCNYDLLVQPSRDEGFGLTVAEGMAAGVPVLVSNLAGPMEVIANGRYGAMFELGTNEVDNCVLQIAEIKDNYGHYKHLAEGEALDFVKKNFDVARVAYKYIEGYKI